MPQATAIAATHAIKRLRPLVRRRSPRPAAAAEDSVVTVVPATAASALVPPAITPPRFVSLRRLTPAEVHDARRLPPLPVLRPPPPSGALRTSLPSSGEPASRRREPQSPK